MHTQHNHSNFPQKSKASGPTPKHCWKNVQLQTKNTYPLEGKCMSKSVIYIGLQVTDSKNDYIHIIIPSKTLMATKHH